MRRGNSAHLHVSLRKGEDYAYVEVFTSYGKEKPSPHVPLAALSVKRGEPQIMKPTTIRLSENRTSHVLTLTADQNCKLYLMQDIDRVGDKLAKGKIYRDGKLYKIIDRTRRWLSRNR